MKKLISFVLVITTMLSLAICCTSAKTNKKFKSTYTVGLNCVKRLILPWDYYDTYDFKISPKNIVKKMQTPEFNEVYGGVSYMGVNNASIPFKGLKEGTAKVTVLFGKKKVATFNILVKPLAPKMPKKTYKMSFSEKGLVQKSIISAFDKYGGEMKNYNFKAKYKLKSSNKSVATVTKDGGVKTTGVGKATISIFETLNKKTKKVCTFNIISSPVTMRAVAKYTREMYDDGLFGNGEFVEYLYVNGVDFLGFEGPETLDMKFVIERYLLNGYGAHFDPEDYTITYVSDNPEIVSVDEKGLATAVGAGSTWVTYKVFFADGTTFKEKVPFSVE